MRSSRGRPLSPPWALSLWSIRFRILSIQAEHNNVRVLDRAVEPRPPVAAPVHDRRFAELIGRKRQHHMTLHAQTGRGFQSDEVGAAGRRVGARSVSVLVAARAGVRGVEPGGVQRVDRLDPHDELLERQWMTIEESLPDVAADPLQGL